MLGVITLVPSIVRVNDTDVWVLLRPRDGSALQVARLHIPKTLIQWQSRGHAAIEERSYATTSTRVLVNSLSGTVDLTHRANLDQCPLSGGGSCPGPCWPPWGRRRWGRAGP